MTLERCSARPNCGQTKGDIVNPDQAEK
jgi:hypothetical protein